MFKQLTQGFMFTWPAVVSFATFTTYHYLGNELTPFIVLDTLMWLAVMTRPMAGCTIALNALATGLVSLRRFDQLLTLEANQIDEQEQNHAMEKSRRALSPKPAVEAESKNEDTAVSNTPTSPKNFLSITNGEFRWQATSPEPTLSNINLSIEKGSFIAIIGPVGSGKSTLLAAMLNELHQSKGGVEKEKNLHKRSKKNSNPPLLCSVAQSNECFFRARHYQDRLRGAAALDYQLYCERKHPV